MTTQREAENGPVTIAAAGSVRRNVAANFAGRAAAAAIPLLLVPIYLRLLGAEAYGLVGFFSLVQALLAQLDLGLGMTANRELARRSVDPGDAATGRDLLRSLEVVYWGLAVAAGVGIALLAPAIATGWVHPGRLPPGEVRRAIALMGLAGALQFPFTLYGGGLLGMQRQVEYNVLYAGAAALRGFGAVVVLVFVSPTIGAFLAWQALAGALQTGLSALVLWRAMPGAGIAPRFRLERLREVRRFATGLTGISLLSVALMQADKILVSALLPLELFGYYSMASTMASGLSVLILPQFSALFPRFSQLVRSGEEAELRRLYHRGCQLMSVAVLPVAFVLALFSREIVLVWTRDPVAASQVSLPMGILAAGTAMNGLATIPYALQLASGWTSLAFWQNAVWVAVLVPFLAWATPRYGAAGAASAWVLVNAGYLLVGIQLMHRRLLPGEKGAWYLDDVARPLLGAGLAAFAARWLFPAGHSPAVVLPALALAWLLVLAASAAAAPEGARRLRAALPGRGRP